MEWEGGGRGDGGQVPQIGGLSPPGGVVGRGKVPRSLTLKGMDSIPGNPQRRRRQMLMGYHPCRCQRSPVINITYIPPTPAQPLCPNHTHTLPRPLFPGRRARTCVPGGCLVEARGPCRAERGGEQLWYRGVTGGAGEAGGYRRAQGARGEERHYRFDSGKGDWMDFHLL